MKKSLFSNRWYRVADLTPRLRSHVDLQRQVFQGQTWYILQDAATGRLQRFSPEAYFIITLMDGHRTMQEIWEASCERHGDAPPPQDEAISLLSRLYAADVLIANVPPDIAELARRGSKARSAQTTQRFKNPLAVRIGLLDPDKFLDATLPFVSWIFSKKGAMIWAVVVFFGIMSTALHWGELTDNVVDRVISTGNLFLLLIAYPVVKAIHELGHGYAAKHSGAEIHEIGIIFLVLIPVPYVDASQSAAFPNKWRRALVGSAGILTEIFLAALAAIVWAWLEPGVARALLFNVMLIGGVSTLLFNGNPLLRFDGYYVLSDLSEIPNLGQRANLYLAYLAKTRLFGVDDIESPARSDREARWLGTYGVLALVYRLFIAVAIILFVAGKFFIIGVLLALWSVYGMFLKPVSKGVWYMLNNSELRSKRRRAGVVIGGAAAALAILFFGVPLPRTTSAEGVVWVPDDAVLRAGADGFASGLLSSPGQAVKAGAPVVDLDDPLLRARMEFAAAQVAELETRYQQLLLINRSDAAVALEELDQGKAEYRDISERAEKLTLTAGANGLLIIPYAQELEGKFVAKGDTIGFILDEAGPIIRIVVNQTDAEALASEIKKVTVRHASRPHEVFAANIIRQTPAATRSLPSPALSVSGGGDFYLDPSSESGLQTIEQLFELDLRAPDSTAPVALGERVYVRFEHNPQPIGRRAWLSVRRLMLDEFNV